ncbi:MAG: T9SS type A sorting domain-containing protein [Aureispira sp.]
MNYSKQFLFFCCFFSFYSIAVGQNFINGDLEGPTSGLAVLPTNWQNVPSTDPVCLATNGSLGDTPDLLDTLGPSAFTGIIGNPYTGSTFVSGGRSSNQSGSSIFQEGIMQQVSGFIPDSIYTIILHQAVVKSYGNEDTSGSWAVYFDGNLAGITVPTTSTVAYTTWPFVWEERRVTFTASSNNHFIKFLPHDDDSNLLVLTPNGALRMGIDQVSIIKGAVTTHLQPIEETNKELVVFPNPCQKDVSIKIKTEFLKGSVAVYGIHGSRMYYQGEVVPNKNGILSLNLSMLDAGVYFLHLHLDGKEYVKKLIKQ